MSNKNQDKFARYQNPKKGTVLEDSDGWSQGQQTQNDQQQQISQKTQNQTPSQIFSQKQFSSSKEPQKDQKNTMKPTNLDSQDKGNKQKFQNGQNKNDKPIEQQKPICKPKTKRYKKPSKYGQDQYRPYTQKKQVKKKLKSVKVPQINQIQGITSQKYRTPQYVVQERHFSVNRQQSSSQSVNTYSIANSSQSQMASLICSQLQKYLSEKYQSLLKQKDDIIRQKDKIIEQLQAVANKTSPKR